MISSVADLFFYFGRNIMFANIKVPSTHHPLTTVIRVGMATGIELAILGVLGTWMAGKRGGWLGVLQIWCVLFSFSGGRWGFLYLGTFQNEYSKQIKEFRSQEKPGKAHGKVFVKGQYLLCFFRKEVLISTMRYSVGLEESEPTDTAAGDCRYLYSQ
jgi:hypothetical protein